MKNPSSSRIAFAVFAVLVAAVPAAARDRDRDQDSRSKVTVVVRPGHSVRALPRDNTRVAVRDHAYFYSGGLFYESRGNEFLVVTAPIGARVRALSPGYVRFGMGGRDYFYFNATFWIWDAPSREYVVVEKPNGGDAALASAEQKVSASTTFYVYPARGQSEEQTRQDRYECHIWAVDEANFDPAAGDNNAAGYADYRRATEACLEGRGYTVR